MLAALAAGMASPPAHATCEDFMPPAAGADGKRDITTQDLARLRDIGYPEVMGGTASPFALSPDGKTIAFVITRGDPKTNSICSALVTVATDGRSSPRVLDRGGALPKLAGVFRGVFISTGLPELITPAWSPDGRSLAYRKLVDGVVQIFRVGADGSGARVVTQSPVNIEDFSWSPDGSHITYLARPGELESKRKAVADGLSGWRYDSSILPQQSWEPQPWASDIPQQALTVDLETGVVRAATEDERTRSWPPPVPGTHGGAAVKASNGAIAWTAGTTDHPEAPLRVWSQMPGGKELPCGLEQCAGRISRIFWEQGGPSVLFLRREGWNGEDWALYRWKPSSGRISLVMRTRDALTGCLQASSELICGRENATTPRRIAALDLKSGRFRPIFDPNPEFAGLRLGMVRRLRWVNDRGLPAWGDLVLPPGYDGHAKLPMVIVQYHSAGFLRGGIGDDYPIYPMAAKGMAVLSFERPPSSSSIIPGLKTWEETLAADHKDWNERRSLLSSLDRGIDAAIATGFIDPGRIGITGLSDGASSVQFALVNSRRFSAAAMSSCCDDLLSSLALGGFAWADENRKTGLPSFVDDDREFWKPLSLTVNARAIDTPILMQLADRETLLALPAFTALRETGKPVELFVYPDEFHDKWQPAHRLATYDRSIDWFAFWLAGREDADPSKREQYSRWEAMRVAAKRTQTP
ncbi:dipeptidyl aminopeptidase/acylaminoacyl peptidase [Novosphingobium sp. PhB165]|uniref:Atxe2 family lasso peptide isopeptidase n=1 Tax=Novosphingobium sp. PhB165 TaxID=2485105 RepID=UPI0010E60AB9|nr:Atxe2 family lasso peptide isopeptidase [Novosphingobium sp. PhB165]TCM14616.1 dipeptidyl aminopeptidase/acylaminoacyl peptidase [Novosphingobium sp. PhB165]